MENNQCCSRIYPLSFGLALGVLWGASVFGMAAMNAYGFHYGLQFVQALGTVYIGYQVSYVGAIIGAIWAFVDATIGGILLAFLYNLFHRVGCCKCKSGNKE